MHLPGLSSWAIAVAVLLSGVSLAHADSYDHLKCYRVPATGSARAVMDIETIPLGVETGCRVKFQATERCLPAADATEATAADASTAAHERLCYKIKCPRRSLPHVEAADRFGTRSLGIKRAATLCLPMSALSRSD